jgi:hypothetical protein
VKPDFSEKKLYHLSLLGLLLIAAAAVFAGCSPPDVSAPRKTIQVVVDAGTRTLEVSLPAGSTVQDVLNAVDQPLEGKDRVEPSASTVLEDDATVKIIRVMEEYETVEEVIPFQVIRQPTENLPEGEEQLLQAGQNGLEEVTYLRLVENGQEISYREVNRVTVEEPVNEIVLVGQQASLAPISIPGRLVYLSDGNAWVMEGSSSNRKLVVAAGDLDGRIFRLSSDGSWLLFTRKEDSEDVINSLWAANITGDNPDPIDLEVQNVIHFADWLPGAEQEVVYSTVETRVSAPGWQANNNLLARKFSQTGWTELSATLVETNFGGVYGWWGTDYEFTPQGDQAAFSSPDQVGLVEVENGQKRTLFKMEPYNTRADWAWMPGIAFSPGGDVLYTVRHAAEPGSASAEESPYFDLVAVPLNSGLTITLRENVGMFAYPLPSPVRDTASGETGFIVAYLQAALPELSATSSYRIAVMDRDGSNQRVIFPSLDQTGLSPQRGWGAWAPGGEDGQGSPALAVLYQGNIWLVDAANGEAVQATGDGRVQRLDW